MTDLDRRSFLGRGLTTAGGVLASGLAIETLAAHASWASAGRPASDPHETGYGPLRRTPAKNTGEELLGRVVRHFVSLNGTIVNCAGGRMLHQRGRLTC